VRPALKITAISVFASPGFVVLAVLVIAVVAVALR